MAKSGIYCIENTINNKKYIGQSKDIAQRWSHHKGALRHNRHENSKLQRAWNKYGENAFVFYVIKECPLEDLNRLEMHYISKFNAFGQGYNLSEGGEAGNNSRGKPIKQYDIYGNFIRRWGNATEAARFYGCCKSSVTRAVVHKSLFMNYQWCYENEEINEIFVKKNQYPLAQYDIQGNLINVYVSIADVVSRNKEYEKNNISHSVKSKNGRTAYGYVWKEISIEDYYRLSNTIDINVQMVAPNEVKRLRIKEGNLARCHPVVDLTSGKKYESIKSTAEDGFRPSDVQKVCAGNAKTHHGHIFAYG